jgi:hypothetical protein
VEEDLALTPLRMPGEHKSATSAPSAMPGVSA